MGKMTEALAATKELRKQFKKQPKKKISKRDQKIIDAISSSDFGCQKENVYLFAEALLERKIPRTQTEQRPTTIEHALVVCVKDFQDFPKGTLCILGENYQNRRRINSVCGNYYTGYDISREYHHPATDKEIREYFE